MQGNIYDDPEGLLQRLIRFNTTNPPGNERACILYIKSLLDDAGIETSLYAKDENRPNLLAVIPSKRPAKPPVMMYGHVDVVPTEGQSWNVDPFAGVIQDGHLYGRGAVDMKSGIALYVCAMLRVRAEGHELDYDLKLLVLSDEEGMGDYGSKFMAEEHPELFVSPTCAMGEIGGFSFHTGGVRFYPIMIAEKQIASVRLTFLGAGGHGSLRHGDTAMTKMARAVTAFANHRLKVRVTPEVALMIDEMAAALGGATGAVLRRLKNPRLTDRLLNLLGSSAALFDNLLHNSVSVTIVRGGTAINVIPARVSIELDLRILPGLDLETALGDIRALLQDSARLGTGDYEIEVLSYDRNDAPADPQHLEAFKQSIRALDPEGVPIPFVLAAVTDGRVFSKLGVTTYGFTPMRLPEGFDFAVQAHNANECLPVGALAFGVAALMQFFTTYY